VWWALLWVTKGVSCNNDFPRLVSVTTTRAIASTFGSGWDVQLKNSKRLPHENNRTNYGEHVLLSVFIHSSEQLSQLENLKSLGKLDFQVLASESHRNLQGIEKELSCYRTVAETYDSVNDLALQYPTFVTIDKIGESWLKEQGQGGNDILVMTLSSPYPANEKSDLMIVAGQHSRELPPPEAVMRWAESLLENYGKDADITWILERTNIHIVPIANPDGREIVQDNLNWLYRKNAHVSGCSSGPQFDGVDLNRNYPFHYGYEFGSSSDPCSSSYRGLQALSEPESIAVYNYAKQLFSDTIKKGSVSEAQAKIDEACPDDASGIYIDIHSSGDFIYFPWALEDREAPNHRSLLTMAAKLAHPGNYSLWGPGQDGFLYFVSGDATDATYGVDCVASYGYEIGSEFYAPCEELESSIVPILSASLLYAAKAVSAPYKIPLGPDILNICVDNTDPSNTILTVNASDEALIVPYAKFNGERSQSIAQVRVHLNDHPYDRDTTGMLMKPLDGAFNSADETATYLLNTSGMVGRYVLYFVATDAEGFEGPVSAVFVDNGVPRNSCASERKSSMPPIPTMSPATTSWPTTRLPTISLPPISVPTTKVPTTGSPVVAAPFSRRRMTGRWWRMMRKGIMRGPRPTRRLKRRRQLII
jgi:carboxypeptidase T